MTKFLLTTGIGIAVFLFQILLSNFITIRGIRPDFMLIFIIYISLRGGSLSGVIVGFSFGLMEDLLSSGSLIGLASLTKSITGFLIGRLKGQYIRMNPLIFHLLWITILIGHFFILFYVSYQSVFEASSIVFWRTYSYATIYTLLFLAILQFIKPLSSILPSHK